MKTIIKGLLYAVGLTLVTCILGFIVSSFFLKHVPEGANVPDTMENEPSPTVDASGRPLIAQPQQPLMSGEQGVPQVNMDINWQIDGTRIASTDSQSEYSSAYDEVDIGGDDFQVTEEEDYPGMVRTHQDVKTRNSWERDLVNELKRCDSRDLNILQRRRCAKEIKQTYCERNNAWNNRLCR